MTSAEELLAGSALTRDVIVPAELAANGASATLRLRPLTVRDLQRITKAVKDDESLSATLMIQHALVDPELKYEQVLQLPAGLARFLIERINEISGIDTPRDALHEFVQAPLAKACFVLAKEFGWTPEEVSGMTIGQILLYLEMSNNGQTHAEAVA
ncbi:MAG: hypothetical protein WCE79_05630 [Xanthobacteraceae bacterium]